MANSEFFVSLPPEVIDDIMCTALEGGITYWCRAAQVVGDYLGEYAHEQISRGGKLLLLDMEDNIEYELDLQKFVAGVHLYLLSDPEESILDGDRKVDAALVDGAVADAIIQYAVFGRIIFS